MARKIRFPLKMKNGAEVRTLDELKENFDLESVLGYFTDGKLATWLADRYYDEKAEAVSALSADTPELNAKLCNILEVEYQGSDDDTDFEYIQRRNEKYRILSALTDDKEILDNIDIVALNEDDLWDIRHKIEDGTLDTDKIYLYGNRNYYYIDKDTSAKNVCYIGIGPEKPVVSIDLANNPTYNGILSLIEYRDKYGITLKNVKYDKFIHEDAVGFYNKGEYDRDFVFEVLYQSAVDGDMYDQHCIGVMYYHGYGVSQDYTEAVKWYRKAAEQGNAAAQCNLGVMYYNGNGVSQDYAEAVKWYRKAAEQGNAIAQSNLGYMYENGYGIEQDKAKAVEWYRKSAEQGNERAKNNLKNMGVTI